MGTFPDAKEIEQQLRELRAMQDQAWDHAWSQLSPERMRTLIERSTVDPEDHDYRGDGTSRCRVCLDSMNAHISWDVQP